MTKHTPPGVKSEWEPTIEGVMLYLTERGLNLDPVSFELSLQDVIELWQDMEEARMLARGYEKVECEVHLVEDKWIIKVMGNDFRVANTFIELHSKHEGVWYCLQDHEGREIVWPATDLVTGYRPVE
jgi:hypothetical protein